MTRSFDFWSSFRPLELRGVYRSSYLIFLGFFLPELRKPEELKKPGTIKSVPVITYPELGLWPEAHVLSLGSGFHYYLV